MPTLPRVRAQPWLRSPLRTPVGELRMAGALNNIAGIDPRAMRVLGTFALVLMVEGRGYYCDALGARRELEPGDVVLVFPDVAHAYGPLEGQDWTQIYAVFGGEQFDLWRRAGLLRTDRPVWRVGAVDYWQQRLAGVLKDTPPPGPGAALRVFGRFVDLVAEMIASDIEASHTSPQGGWVERSLRLLGTRTARGWLRPQEVAGMVGLSYETFRKRFTQASGESPGQYQKRRRLDWACAAMYQGEHSIKEIAEELGFCDVFHFSKAFKQVIGSTPSEYRRRVRGR